MSVMTQNKNDFNELYKYGIYSNINGKNLFYTKIKIMCILNGL